MTKEEFLNALGNKLSEDLSESEIVSELRYYEGYIDAEVSRGKSEEEATDQLGDPILIARNIAEAPRNSYGYREATYEQGYEEATYQQTKAVTSDTESGYQEVEAEEYAPDYEFGENALTMASLTGHRISRLRRPRDSHLFSEIWMALLTGAV